MRRISVVAPDGLPEVRRGDDLAALLAPFLDLTRGDVVVVTSKVVSKAEGRVVAGTREGALAGETARVVARRGPTTIARTHHGLTLAAAGIDASNVEQGSVVLLPLDPDASARSLRSGLRAITGVNVAVVVTDTAGRAWREGQTDIAVGAAGLRVAEDYAGQRDAHGNELAVTAPAVADEIAGAAELAQGKLGRRPVAVVRGRSDLVLDAGDDGPGARWLIRDEGGDLFGYGAREAVLRAVRARGEDQAPFGEPVTHDELQQAFRDAGVDPDDPADAAGVRLVAFAHGWTLAPADAPGDTGLRPATP